MPHATRRQWMKAATTSAVGLGLAGCTGSSGDEGTSTGEPGGDEPIRVGFITPLSGPTTVYGKLLRRAGEIAADEVNLGRNALFDEDTNRKIEMFIEDEAGDPSVAAEAARRLINEENVDIITGVLNSHTGSAINSVVSREQIPHLMTLPSANSLVGEDCIRYAFNFTGDTWMYSYPTASYIADNVGASNLYLLGMDYEFGRQSNKFLKEGLAETNASVADEVYLSFGTTDFGPSISSIRDSGADAVWTSVVGASAISFANQAANSGLIDEIEILGPSVSGSETVIRAAGESTAGIYSVLPWHFRTDKAPGVNERFMNSMDKAYEDINGVRPSHLSAHTWENIHLIDRLVREAGSTNGEDLINLMEGYSYTGFNGQKHWRETDHLMVQNVFVVENVMSDDYDLPVPETRHVFDLDVADQSPDNCTF